LKRGEQDQAEPAEIKDATALISVLKSLLGAGYSSVIFDATNKVTTAKAIYDIEELIEVMQRQMA
jgi:hypothetical protein